MSDEKKMVSEKLEVLLSEEEAMDFQQFVDKIQDIKTQNQHRAFEKFSIGLTRTKELGWLVVFNGERPETQDEQTKREAIENARRKSIEENEIKEYLRLKKKYAKNEN